MLDFELNTLFSLCHKQALPHIPSYRPSIKKCKSIESKILPSWHPLCLWYLLIQAYKLANEVPDESRTCNDRHWTGPWPCWLSPLLCYVSCVMGDGLSFSVCNCIGMALFCHIIVWLNKYQIYYCSEWDVVLDHYNRHFANKGTIFRWIFFHTKAWLVIWHLFLFYLETSL